MVSLINHTAYCVYQHNFKNFWCKIQFDHLKIYCKVMSNAASGGGGGAVAEQLALMQKMMEEQERRLMQQQEQVRKHHMLCLGSSWHYCLC